MTAPLTAPRPGSCIDVEGDSDQAIGTDRAERRPPARPLLRLVDGDRRRSDRPLRVDRPIPTEQVRRRSSPAVRRRRGLLAVTALALTALAFPLGGAGGASHATGSALAGTGSTDYTVRPGDTLWSIAVRMDPSADPRPTVARLASEIGTYQVVPGERLVLH